MTHSLSQRQIGFTQAVLAFVIWGGLPLYFKQLTSVSPFEVVAMRTIWSIVLLFFILWLRKNFAGLKIVLVDKKTRLLLFFSAMFLISNWTVYVLAVNAEQVVAASLGYFISPLLNIFLAMIVLKEKLNRNQLISVALAAIGISFLLIDALDTLWISLCLAGTWGGYSLIRKIAPVGPVVGLTVETGIALPLMLFYLMWAAQTGPGLISGQDIRIDLLLVLGAFVTITPLLLFNAAIQKISFTSVALVQYLGPTIQFLLGVFVYDEPFTTSHILCFTMIWLGLLLFSWDMIKTARAEREPQTVSQH